MVNSNRLLHHPWPPQITRGVRAEVMAIRKPGTEIRRGLLVKNSMLGESKEGIIYDIPWPGQVPNWAEWQLNSS